MAKFFLQHLRLFHTPFYFTQDAYILFSFVFFSSDSYRFDVLFFFRFAYWKKCVHISKQENGATNGIYFIYLKRKLCEEIDLFEHLPSQVNILWIVYCSILVKCPLKCIWFEWDIGCDVMCLPFVSGWCWPLCNFQPFSHCIQTIFKL